MIRYWVGPVSQDHVQRAVREEFAQVCHGKESQLARMSEGDFLLYYSPKTSRNGTKKLQAFTAAGKMLDDDIFTHFENENFQPARRKVFYCQPVRPCPIEFVREHPEWKSYATQLRYGLFEVSRDFYMYVFNYMKDVNTGTLFEDHEE